MLVKVKMKMKVFLATEASFIPRRVLIRVREVSLIETPDLFIKVEKLKIEVIAVI